MSWLRIEGKMPSHRKVAPLSDAAFRLHVTALAWCVEQKTNGEVPANIPATFPSAPRGKKLVLVVDELIAAGLWVVAELGSWRIHDFLEFNPRAEEVSSARREAGKRGARARWGDGKPDGNCHRPSDGKAIESAIGKTMAKDASDSDSDSDSDQIPPTPDGKPAPPRESTRLGLGGFEVEEFLSGVADATGRRPASPSFLDRQHVARGLELCPLPRGATSDEVLAWVRASAREWSELHTRAGKVQFQRGWHPAKWVEWLSAGCPDPNAAPSVARQRVDATPTALPSAADNDAFWRQQEAKDRAAREQLAKRKAGGQ